MRIAGLAHALPSRRVTNDDVLELIRSHSADTFHGDLDDALRQVEFLLGYTGSGTRRWSTDDERPIDLLVRAGESALAAATLDAGDVETVVYTGVARGFLEPGGAYHAARALGIERAQCFDTLDACMSWVRSTQIAQGLFASGACGNVLVVNAEFGLRHTGHVYPHLFALPHTDALAWTFPAFTLGEAATATVLTDDGAPWAFAFASRADLAELCNVPLAGYADFCLPSEKVASNGPDRFSSYGHEMHEAGRDEAFGVLDRLDAPADDAVALFTHASSRRWWEDMAREVGLHDRLHSVFSDTGNVVSASVPVAVSDAVERGVLRRGDRALGWVGSAGMSFASFSFVY